MQYERTFAPTPNRTTIRKIVWNKDGTANLFAERTSQFPIFTVKPAVFDMRAPRYNRITYTHLEVIWFPSLYGDGVADHTIIQVNKVKEAK